MRHTEFRALERSKHLSIFISLVLLTLDPFIPREVGADDSERIPVIVFPAFHFTILEVFVEAQSVAPECPDSGVFEDWFQNEDTSAFNQICRDKLMTLAYNPDPALPMSERFSNQPGVTVRTKYFGSTKSAPFYEPLYAFLENLGYQQDIDIRVAGYDSRLTPDMGNFMARTVALIEETYRENNDSPVHLVGHSNGPLYAHYLLTHTSQEWKDKHIHGFTAIAGNWPGQGIIYPVYFTGLNTSDFSFPTEPENAVSSALMYQTHPSSYMSSADPEIFEDSVVVVRSAHNGAEYTPRDNIALFRDAGLTLAETLAAHYVGFVEFAHPDAYPNVDVYAEKGSGFETIVGIELPDLTVGSLLDDSTLFFTRPDGDANQEDITNNAISVWSEMPCYRFELTDNAGVDHFALASNEAVLQRLLLHLNQSKSVCP